MATQFYQYGHGDGDMGTFKNPMLIDNMIYHIKKDADTKLEKKKLKKLEGLCG